MAVAFETETRMLPVKSLALSPRVQPRSQVHWSTIQEYAEEMKAGTKFPAIVVFTTGTPPYYVADGWHRVEAAKLAKVKELKAEVRFGSIRDAILFAAGANRRHGIRRSNADKQRVVTTLLKDREWSEWNDTEIARRCGVSVGLVTRIRETLGDDRPYRLQFNGRGELQYRAAKNMPRDEPAQGRPTGAEKRRVKCPHCGKWLEVAD